MSFVECESYLHRTAKNVVADWLRETMDDQGEVHFDNIHYRANRAPTAGVLVEYPLGINGEGFDPCWDEHFGFADDPRGFVPSFDFLARQGIRVACVCDVVVLHKGMVGAAIEIIHKHPTPESKKDFLRRKGVQLIEVSAVAVMHCIKRPDSLPLWTPHKRRRRAQ